VEQVPVVSHVTFVSSGGAREMGADKARREAGYGRQFLAALECPQQRCSGGRAEGLVHKMRVLHSGGCGFNVGRDCHGEVVGWRVGGCRRRCCRSKGDHPKSCVGAFVGAQHDVTAMQYGASNFGEGNIAAGIAERDDRNEGMGRQVGDDVGEASGHGECRDGQRACVR
jgi:hypothetical protein